LSARFDVVVAASGRDGLTILQNQGPFAVVLSDLRMPGMNGATFLGQVRQLAPDTVRLLVTGDANPDDPIADINEGDVFRCLEKPFPFDLLIKTVEAAVEHYRLAVPR
jgi:DNA-binding NtrC family response regulator